MRQIEFRAAFYKHSGEFDMFQYWGIDVPEEGSNSFPGSSRHSVIKTHDQFTGLIDKNESEIYENDIIKGYLTMSDQSGDDIYDFTGSVEYTGCAFEGSRADFPLDQYTELEVIGNIHENPELLK